jgi:tetratricopeptide (TPR) repeat protein
VTLGFDRGQAFQVFERALALSEPARGAFVRESCGENAALRIEVEALLEAAKKDQVHTSLLLGSPPRPIENLIGECYGHFRLVELVGEGGMGVVYRAERTDGIRQVVAIKLIARELGERGRERFYRETQLLARLEHPAIARLIDAGVEAGRAWIALEFVPGQPIDRYCDANRLPLRARVALLAKLAAAVAAAHGMLVVHRDIKPANVLVTADGLPKLIDFGIATVLQDSATAHSQTIDVGRLFTPHYAAPEQVSGEPATVATDVFGLGALGFRLLTGQLLYPEARGVVGYLLAITQREMAAPSRSAADHGDPRRAKELRGDLDAILCKALDRYPSRRYVSAASMQADLQRYLDGVPVSARKQTVSYRAVRFVHRHLFGVSVAAALICALTAGAVIYGQQAQSVAQARNMAARRDEFLESLLKSADPRSGKRDVSVAQLLDSATQELDRKLSGEPLVEASMLSLIAQTNIGLGRYQEGLAANDRELKILREHGGTALALGQALSTRGELLREQGRWAEADPVVRQAAAVLSSLQVPRDLCGALYLLAVVLQHTDRANEAEATYHRVIEIEEGGDTDLKLQRMYPYQGLVILLADQARYAEAAIYARSALELAQKGLAADDPALLGMQWSYAGALINIHRAAEAEPLLRRTIEAETRVLGAGHKDTLIAQRVLADDLLELHRDAEAAAVALATARQFEALLGMDNTYTLAAWNDYAAGLCNSHQEVAGLKVLERVDQARRKVYPPGDCYIYTTLLSIGVCHLRLQHYAQAETELKAASQGLEATRGPHYRRTQQAYQALHELYMLTGHSEEAGLWAAKTGP